MIFEPEELNPAAVIMWSVYAEFILFVNSGVNAFQAKH